MSAGFADYPGEWVVLAGVDLAQPRPGVHEVVGRDDVVVVVYDEDGDTAVVPRACPHLSMDLVRVGMVNCTTRQLTCYHKRQAWDLPSGVAARGAAMQVYPSRVENGRLLAYLPAATGAGAGAGEVA